MEMMVVISITTIGLLGISSLVVQNQQAQTVNKNYIIGSMLAQEGLELVRNVRDNNWLNEEDWSGDTTGIDIVEDGTYTINFDGTINPAPDLISEASAKLYFDANGYYSHIVSTNNTSYRRLITVIDNTDYIIVNSTVSWPVRGGNTKLYEAETYLYDWH